MTRSCTFKGSPLSMVGNEIIVGQESPVVTLTSNDLSDWSTKELEGKVSVLICFPSLDTPVCSLETKRFNDSLTTLAGNNNKLLLLAISRDLPFAQKRWCGSQDVSFVKTVSDYKYRTFGASYGALIKEWELLSRAVFVLDQKRIVRYVEYVEEVSAEPQYDAALMAVRTLIM